MFNRPSNPCKITLSTGLEFEGVRIGADAEASGEIVFTTGIAGYAEALTDPSFFGQILVFAYPMIGNYGVPQLPNGFYPELFSSHESQEIQVEGVIFCTDQVDSFHWEQEIALGDWLKKHNIPGVVGVDTRYLIRHIREHKSVMGRIQNTLSKCQDFFDVSKKNVLPEVSIKEPRILGEGKRRVAILDLGVKWSIIRSFLNLGVEVQLLPWNADLSKVDCSGFVLSNGPGDPKQTGDLIERAKYLFQQDKPVLGICLGHQILALASGSDTIRMPYGHRGHNQPVKEAFSGQGYMTSQNHGYSVSKDGLSPDWNIWFENLNDQSIEGLSHKYKNIKSIQFHPEANGGPRDTTWILKNFVNELEVSP